MKVMAFKIKFRVKSFLSNQATWYLFCFLTVWNLNYHCDFKKKKVSFSEGRCCLVSCLFSLQMWMGLPFLQDSAILHLILYSRQFTLHFHVHWIFSNACSCFHKSVFLLHFPAQILQAVVALGPPLQHFFKRMEIQIDRYTHTFLKNLKIKSFYSILKTSSVVCVNTFLFSRAMWWKIPRDQKWTLSHKAATH